MVAQIINICLGIWLMAAPSSLSYSDVAADNDYILGPVIASVALIALSGCTRSIARMNLLFGCWLIIAPWILHYDLPRTSANDMITGILVSILSFYRRKANHQYGGGWSVLWKGNNISIDFERLVK